MPRLPTGNSTSACSPQRATPGRASSARRCVASSETSTNRRVFSLGEYLTRTSRRRTAQTAQWDVTEHAADFDVGAVRGERHHRALEGASDRVFHDEGEEGHRVVEREEFPTVAPSPSTAVRPATFSLSPALVAPPAFEAFAILAVPDALPAFRPPAMAFGALGAPALALLAPTDTDSLVRDAFAAFAGFGTQRGRRCLRPLGGLRRLDGRLHRLHHGLHRLCGFFRLGCLCGLSDLFNPGDLSNSFFLQDRQQLALLRSPGLKRSESPQRQPRRKKPAKAVKAVVKAVKAAVKPTKAAKGAKAATAAPVPKPAKAAKASRTSESVSVGARSARAGAPKAPKAMAGGRKAGKASGTAKMAKASKAGGATKAGDRKGGRAHRGRGGRRPPRELLALNDPMAFLTFITEHPVGSTFEGTVVSFTSHGAHIEVGGMLCHVPLHGLARTAPTAHLPRQVLAKEEVPRFVLVSLDATHRRAELALPGVAR